jgi:hypothetical protein
VDLHTLALLNPEEYFWNFGTDSAFRVVYAIFTLDTNFLRYAWNNYKRADPDLQGK